MENGNYGNFPLEICLVVILIVMIIFIYYSDNKIKDQIKEDIEKKGGIYLSKEWTLPRLIHRGSFEVYKVRYLDADRNEHIAICKPSLIGDAYWTDDIIITKVKSDSDHITAKQ